MDGSNADSDHSMTWEDFFGSTTDLTPTLLGIYDSLLEPAKSLRPEVTAVETAKDARNDPPVSDNAATTVMTEETIDNTGSQPRKDPTKIAGSVKLPIATVNKSSLYSARTKSDNNGASEIKSEFTTSETTDYVSDAKVDRTIKELKQSEPASFGNLSPNVKRMISSASETTTLKFQKKSLTATKSYTRQRSNIPLVGATSKISQSGVDLLTSVEIYDKPSALKSFRKTREVSKSPIKAEPEPKLEDVQTTYDVPISNRPAIYDIPNVNNKTAFESLSLPYIDQSIELSITSNDREFDIQINSKENSPQQHEPISSPDVSPAKFPKTLNGGTNSLHRKDFIAKSDSPSKLSKIGSYPEAVGSTGNLKACVIPEKEVVRLNPAVEVSRPQSMSSITSSSSTSSSGVQNKGGVNSAYLASIESLDDHSDADMTSAIGSNNFVNNAGTRTSEDRKPGSIAGDHTEEMAGLSQLERVCAEIVQTENIYVEDLRQVVEGYLHVWRRESTFSDEELVELFNNIEDIYSFNRSLCEELNTCGLDATCMARCFVNNTAGFSVYTSYCTGYPRTMERLATLALNPDSALEFRERQSALGHPLPLASYLLKPVQRILKYHLLLQNVVKQCKTDETEYALHKMTGIAQHIDDMKRRHEHAVRVQEIQSLLYGWNGPDLTTYGELCAEGTFRVFGAKAMRHAFLFDNMLLITKNREDGILAYKSHIMCNNMMLVESIAGAPLSFHVIPWDAPRAQLTLQARSHTHKREWTLLLKRVILENYNAVIPSHARQLVMELGQNKTDDDILAEKSHNLITQASMRKQLSAPEYLEKRKLERERRKSFENGIRGRLKKVSRKTTAPTRSDLSQECDCVQISAEKGIDYTCDSCYIDLCSDCESKLNKNKPKDEKCICKNEDHEINGDKCPECDRSLQYIDACSTERLDRKQSGCNCSDFVSSQESFNKDYGSSLNKTRGYHSSDNIVGYTENGKSKDDLSDINDSMTNIRNIPKTCLKCSKIKENIVVTDISSTLSRKSRCNDNLKHRADTFRSKSRDDPHRSKLSKIGTWRRKSEPGLQNNNIRKTHDSDSENTRGSERIEFECRNCGSNKISKKSKTLDSAIGSENELDAKAKSNLEVRMYTTKNIPKKISKLKKNRAKGLMLGSDKTAKFYTDFSTDVSTENILHISESNDSLNVEKVNLPSLDIPATISKDDNIDEETYKKLIEKTDSFKKNELEKVKHLNKQKVINEGSETEDKICENEDVQESCEETEQPLEQIISQLLMQNRELQKVLKKQQLRNTAQRRHQRLLKSHSNPEHVIIARNFDATKMKPKFGRQTSEVIDIQDQPEQKDLKENDEIKIDKTSEEDHIYETLRVEPRVNENLHSINSKSKLIQHNSHISRPKRIPSPPSTLVKSEINKFDSDYVYLSFDQLNNINDDSIYDVPVKSPQKIDTQSNEYHVPIDIVGSPKDKEDVYDNLIDVCRRKKDVPNHLPTTNYNPMNTDDQSPNTPEIWLSRQKEHFNVSRDRKSGSLPRSFQVITSNQEDNLSSFKCTPNSNSKTFLNREGKVLSIDRPFTIASDQSELSYDDLENYMNDGERLKFAKTITKDSKDVPDFSQSTLELEEEIDRCYRNNFDKIDLDANKNENLLNIAQTNLNTSTASSFEILPTDRNEEIMKETEVIHPEHKIYKPTSNMLSLKNVLNRFKNKTPNKSIEEQEVNANEQSTPDSVKTEVKSPSNEKRSALNPRSYSKNLLQRFKSIISDEHTDDNENKESDTKHRKSIDTIPKRLKSDIKVVITSSDVTPTTSTIYSISNDPLSKSVCDNTTLSESQNEKNNLEELSHSCDNITEKPYSFRPSYEKSVSLITNISAVSSPSKSNNSSFQSLNKLPIYMQGSKHLGARIAQSDYADPSTLATEKTALKNINVLINKSAVRPDSLFSNSSFVTSSSEGCQENQIKTAITTNTISEEEKTTNETKSDESFYEKTFEKIEHITGEDVFRDSAVYSDQDETEDVKMQSTTKDGHGINKVVTRVESINRNQAQKITITRSITETKSSLTKVNKIQSRSQPAEEKVRNKIESKVVNSEKISKSKNAPPVPIKPKISSIPSSTFYTRSAINNKLSSIKVDEKIEGTITKSFKRSITSKPLSRSEILGKNELNETNPIDAKTESKEKNTVETENLNKSYQGNIQIKRLSFERASLDSATRKSKATNEDTSDKQFKTEPSSVTSKSVMERRMEIELMSKSQTSKTSNIKKPGQIIRPKSITMKVATFERSMSDRGDNSKRDTNTSSTSSSEKPNIPTIKTSISEQIKTESEDVDAKGSWVKQVVNKFQ